MSFYTALTGLNAATAQLGVTSNNIANVGTTGFKRSRADFGDIFATSPLQKASSVIGQGVALKSVTQEFSQGNIQFSASSLDIAITGDGFFPLKSADGLQDIYTRNGTFLLDDSFAVVNSAGQALMAASVDSSGKADLDNLRKLIIPRSTTGDARETTAIELGLNLPADGEVIAADFDPNDASTYNLTTAVTVFDSGGNDYLATVYYVKRQTATPDDPTNKWQTHVYIGETKLDELLIQSGDAKGELQYVNKYGEIRSESEIPAESIARGVTKLFNLDDLKNPEQSIPASVSSEPMNPSLITEWKNGIEIGPKLTGLGVTPQSQRIGFSTSGLADTSFVPGQVLSLSDGTRTFSVPEVFESRADSLDLLVKSINASPAPYVASVSSTGDLLLTSANPGVPLTGTFSLKHSTVPATVSYPLDTLIGHGGRVTVSGPGLAEAVAVDYVNTTTTSAADTSRTIGLVAAGLNQDPTFNTKYVAVADPRRDDFSLTPVAGAVTAVSYSVTGPAIKGTAGGVATPVTATTVAGLVTRLNADDKFKEYYVASEVAGKLRVETRNPVLTALPGTAATLGFTVSETVTAATVATQSVAAVSQSTGIKVFPKDPDATALEITADLSIKTKLSSAAAETSATAATTAFTAGTELTAAASLAQGNVGDITFDLNVDGSAAPVKVDLSYLNLSTQRYTGAEIAREMTNAINKAYGDERYFDFSALREGNTATLLRLSAVDVTGQSPTDADTISISLSQGETADFPDLSKVTVDEAVRAIQRKITAAASSLPEPQKTNLGSVRVGFDAKSQSFTFKSSTGKDVYVRSGTDVRNDLLGLEVLPTQADSVSGQYGVSTPPNGALIRDAADQRYGVRVTFDDTARVFRISSGETGDESSIKVSNASDLANSLFGFTKGAAGIEVRTSATPLRGITSEPAVLQGDPIGVNINNKFRVDASNNQFVVTVDNVTGLVTIPEKADYTAGEFVEELERRINSLADSFGRTVNGVTVEIKQNSLGQSFFEITTGTTGDDSFLKVSANSIWGLADVESARGNTSRWLIPPQARNEDGFPLYVDRDGNETTDPGDFSEEETLDLWSPIFLDKGELTFDTAGNLVSPLSAIGFEATTIGETGATLEFSIDYAGSTQYSSPFSVLAQDQNGRPEGDLIGLDIGDDGLVSANYSNGTQKNLAKVVLANFTAPTGLRQIGDASYYATSQSGAVTLGEAGTAGFGTVRAGARERANVDLTQELIELITAQRNFQANAKAIETNNTLTQAIINIRS